MAHWCWFRKHSMFQFLRIISPIFTYLHLQFVSFSYSNIINTRTFNVILSLTTVTVNDWVLKPNPDLIKNQVSPAYSPMPLISVYILLWSILYIPIDASSPICRVSTDVPFAFRLTTSILILLIMTASRTITNKFTLIVSQPHCPGVSLNMVDCNLHVHL